MQTITIASVNRKTFQKKDNGGQGEFYIIKDTDGNEYSTFDGGLAGKEGAVVDIEIKMNRGKANISKYEIKQAAPAGSTASNGAVMTNEMWEAKERREHISQEGMAAVKEVTLAEIHKVLDPEDDKEIITLWKDALKSKLRAFVGSQPPSTTKAATRETLKAKPSTSEAGKFNNVGEMLTYFTKRGISAQEVLDAVSAKSVTDISDPNAAYEVAKTLLKTDDIEPGELPF